jgi:hypothetical protein
MVARRIDRTREDRFIRELLRGNSARSSARLAGYSEQYSDRLKRRLAPLIEARRRGHHDPVKISRRDVHRVLRMELARIADHWGRNRDRVQAQTLRDLAPQVRPSDAREHLKRIDAQLHREARNGGPMPRTLKIRELCRDLIAEIGKLSGPEGDAPHITSEERRELGAQAMPATTPPRCPRHDSQVAGACSWCDRRHGIDNPVERWRAEDAPSEASDYPPRYGGDW